MAEEEALLLTRTIVTELAGTRAGAAVASYLPEWAKDIGNILIGSAVTGGLAYGYQQIPGNQRMKNMSSTYSEGAGGGRGSKAPRIDDPVYEQDPTQPIPISQLPPEYHDVDPNGDQWIHPVPSTG